MGKFDGKQIVGLVGPIIFKKGKNGTIVQTKATKVNQSAATKESASIFGIASAFSKNLRVDLTNITQKFYDGGMVNRLNAQNRAIFEQCYNKDTKKFTFNETSFSRLAGFEFNLESPLINSLWATPQINISANSLTLSLPAFEVPEQLKFPNNANTCELTVFLSLYVPDQEFRDPPAYQSIEINNDQKNVPAQEFIFEVPDGCLCIVGIKLNYFWRSQNIKTVINQKNFNPAGICAAIITP